jgi:hypothetical protein
MTVTRAVSRAVRAALGVRGSGPDAAAQTGTAWGGFWDEAQRRLGWAFPRIGKGDQWQGAASGTNAAARRALPKARLLVTDDDLTGGDVCGAGRECCTEGRCTAIGDAGLPGSTELAAARGSGAVRGEEQDRECAERTAKCKASPIKTAKSAVESLVGVRVVLTY